MIVKKSNILVGGDSSKIIKEPLLKKKITWKQKINEWKNGINLPKINKNIMFETSPIDFTKKDWGFYKEKQIITTSLNSNTLADIKPFKEYLKKNKFVVFDNLDKKCRLVCPPNDGNNYSHIHNFYIHANNTLIKALWKNVAIEVEKIYKTNKIKKIWVSTHGLGINWLHIRICNTPKYYKTVSFTR